MSTERPADAPSLLRQLLCDNPAQMHYQELAKRTDFFKHETKGVNAVCEIMKDLVKDLQDESRREGRTEGENRLSQLMSILLKTGQIEKATAVTESKELRKQLYKQYNIV